MAMYYSSSQDLLQQNLSDDGIYMPAHKRKPIKMTSSQQAEDDPLALHQPPSKKQKMEEVTPIKKLLAPSSNRRVHVIHAPSEELFLPCRETLEQIIAEEDSYQPNCDIHREPPSLMWSDNIVDPLITLMNEFPEIDDDDIPPCEPEEEYFNPMD